MPRTEYVTLAELKASITMDAGTVDRDDLLTIALDAAHDDLEADCGRRFYLDAVATAREFETDGRLVVDRSGSTLLVDDIGSVTGLVVETGWGSSWSTVTSAYRALPENAIVQGKAIDGLRLVAGGGGYWPAYGGEQLVRVTAKWGWPTVPPRVKQACLLQASRLYARLKSPQGVVGSSEWGQIRVSRLDPDVFKLVSQLVKPGF